MSEGSLGLLAIFPSAGELERAARLVRSKGIRDFEILSPFALEEIFPPPPRERNPRRLNAIGLIALLAGLAGMASAFGLQWLANSWAFPLNVGGRPDLSWPNFVPITFVVSILCAGCSIFIGLLLILGLPEPYHPVFNSPAFNLDEERFYLFVAQADPGFDRAALTALFAAFPAARVEEVFP